MRPPFPCRSSRDTSASRIIAAFFSLLESPFTRISVSLKPSRATYLGDPDGRLEEALYAAPTEAENSDESGLARIPVQIDRPSRSRGLESNFRQCLIARAMVRKGLSASFVHRTEDLAEARHGRPPSLPSDGNAALRARSADMRSAEL
ncbi:MAG: hypothetical protein P8R42_07745 [Candidatus Binatia bacterium]|nr:hypothetical protein [Candidatus Binatia bacterium]